jgi:hypothetical protein
MSFAQMVASVNRLHKATAAESRRIRNAKLKAEAAKAAAALHARHLAEENRAIRQLQIKLAAAARSPTQANVKTAANAMIRYSNGGYKRKGSRFTWYN